MRISNFKLKIDNSYVQRLLFFLILLFLPAQFGKHFWPEFSIVSGLMVDYLSPTIYMTDVLVSLLFFVWATKKLLIFNFKFKIKSKPLKLNVLNIKNSLKISNLKFQIGLVVFLIVGIFLSKSQMNGWYGLIKFLEFLFLGMFISKLDLRKLWPKVLILLTIGILFESLLAAAQFLHQSSIGGPFYFLGERSFTGLTPGIANAVVNGELVLRPYATFPHPNVLAGYLTIAMAIVISNFKFQSSNLQKILYGMLTMIGTSALFLTMSRVAIALWIIILSMWFLIRLREILLKNRLLLFVPVVFIWIFFSLPSANRFLQIDFSQKEFVRRIELTTVSIKMVYDHPIVGVGLHNFLIHLPDYQTTDNVILYLQPAHNIYLLIASETGLIGLFFSVWFIAKTYKRIMNQESGIRQKKFILHNSYFIILSIVLVLGFFDHYFLTLQQGQLLTALVFGLCWNETEQFHGKIIL